MLKEFKRILLLILFLLFLLFLLWYVGYNNHDFSVILEEEKEKKKKNIKKPNYRSKGEEITCTFLSEYFNKPFESIRPDWLANPETGRNLELDCYNEELSLAAEYNGEQHYRWPNFTNQTKEEFLAQLRRDKHKKKICEQRNIKLIIVPYTVKREKIKEFILEQLK